METVDFSYTLTPIKIGDIYSYYDVEYRIVTINDQRQKWRFEPVSIESEVCKFRISNIDLHDFSLQRNIKTNEVSIRPISEKDLDYEELYLLVSETTSDTCILLQQDAKTKLVYISLSWFYEYTNYVLRPENNSSKASGP